MVTYPDTEAVERVLVDVLELFAQAQGVVGHRGHVAEAAEVTGRSCQA